MTEKKRTDLTLHCGLWRQKARSGMEYLKGKTNRNILIDAGHTLLIFPNSKRVRENQPEFYLYSSPPSVYEQGKAQGPDESTPHSGEEGKKNYARTHKVGSPPSEEPEEGKQGKSGDDDVPF